MDQKITLYELSLRIKEGIEQAVSDVVWVVGEISELKENRNGHCYLELIEKQHDTLVARARATIWSGSYRILKPYFETATGQSLTQGIKVLVLISVEYHPVYGLSLNIKDIDPAYTLGDMAMRRKEIITQLKRDGIFNMNRELEMTIVPQRIAVISSSTAAGYQDFYDHIINNIHGFKFQITLFNAFMQGVETVPSIITALEMIYEQIDHFDAVAIIRGGGATADLNSFDDYSLASHVAQFPLPVVTGIGHEKDDTIIDLVSYTRLKTPTAVAEFFIEHAQQFMDQIEKLEIQLSALVRDTIRERQIQLEDFVDSLHSGVKIFIEEKNRGLTKKVNQIIHGVRKFTFDKKFLLNSLKSSIHNSVSSKMIMQMMMLERMTERLKSEPGRFLKNREKEITVQKELFKRVAIQYLNREFEKLDRFSESMRLLNPDSVLKRGFTITRKEGVVIKSIESVKVGDIFETHFYDGQILSTITSKEQYEHKKNELQ